MTRSSVRTSSPPFIRNQKSRPSDPLIRMRLGCVLESNTVMWLSSPRIVTPLAASIGTSIASNDEWMSAGATSCSARRLRDASCGFFKNSVCSSLSGAHCCRGEASEGESRTAAMAASSCPAYFAIKAASYGVDGAARTVSSMSWSRAASTGRMAAERDPPAATRWTTRLNSPPKRPSAVFHTSSQSSAMRRSSAVKSSAWLRFSAGRAARMRAHASRAIWLRGGATLTSRRTLDGEPDATQMSSASTQSTTALERCASRATS